VNIESIRSIVSSSLNIRDLLLKPKVNDLKEKFREIKVKEKSR